MCVYAGHLEDLSNSVQSSQRCGGIAPTGQLMAIGQIWLMATQPRPLTLLDPPNGHLGNLPLQICIILNTNRACQMINKEEMNHLCKPNLNLAME